MMEELQTNRSRVALPFLVGLGLVLRLFHYGRNPVMWHDEAATVLNVLHKSFCELLGPLYASATGPPAFLWVQKCAVLAFGDSTYALRLVSMLASCAGLILFASIARKMLGSIGSAGAVLLVACSDRLLWHAAEARHYSSDFLVATLLLGGLGLTTEWRSGKRAALFSGVAPLAIFASYPGVFLGGGVFIALWPAWRRQRRWAEPFLLAAAIVLAFVAFYFITVRVQRSAAMDAAWVNTFPDWGRPWTMPWWLVRSTIDVVGYFFRPVGAIFLVAAVAGSFRFWRNGRRELVLFAFAPMLLAIGAALVKSYPYTGARTMVFAMPALTLLIGGGFDGIAGWGLALHARRLATFVLIWIPLAAVVGLACFRVAVPWPRADTAAASAYVLEPRAPTDPVTANHWEYEYYFRHLGSEFTPNLRLLDEPTPPPRVWIVVTGGNLSLRDALLEPVLRRWRVAERHEFARTSVLLAVPRS